MNKGNDYLRLNPDVKNLVNINEEENLAVWLFPKTASRLFCDIMSGSGFQCYSYNGNERELIKDDIVHHHLFHLFPNINDYRLITTVRNPYSLLAAHYYMSKSSDGVENIKLDFQKFLEDSLFRFDWYREFLYGLNYVEISYKIRMENLIEDYYNLPTIKKTKPFKENTLSNLLTLNTYKSPNPLKNLDFRFFYNEDSADLVYYNFIKYFEIFDYDKNSWK